jgi:hypothetical protein
MPDFSQLLKTASHETTPTTWTSFKSPKLFYNFIYLSNLPFDQKAQSFEKTRKKLS